MEVEEGALVQVWRERVMQPGAASGGGGVSVRGCSGSAVCAHDGCVQVSISYPSRERDSL